MRSGLSLPLHYTCMARVMRRSPEISRYFEVMVCWSVLLCCRGHFLLIVHYCDFWGFIACWFKENPSPSLNRINWAKLRFFPHRSLSENFLSFGKYVYMQYLKLQKVVCFFYATFLLKPVCNTNNRHPASGSSCSKCIHLVISLMLYGILNNISLSDWFPGGKLAEIVDRPWDVVSLLLTST